MNPHRLLDDIVLRIPWSPDDGAPPEPLVDREWLVTNGIGGYASSSVANLITRRYHGMLVAALPNPHGRMVVLNHVVERVRVGDGEPAQLSGVERSGQQLDVPAARHLESFRLEAGLPVWEFAVDGGRVVKRVRMPYGQNTVHVEYVLRDAVRPALLELRPAVHFRRYEDAVTTPDEATYQLTVADGHYAITGDPELPALQLRVLGGDSACVLEPERLGELHYRVEQHRGYAHTGHLWSPGKLQVTLLPDTPVTLVASTEPHEVLAAMTSADACHRELERRRRLVHAAPRPPGDAREAQLLLAADQFLVTPAGRQRERVRALAVGDEVRTVIAGYHWFTDWGRDTMISLEGLTLASGRQREAGFILRTFGDYVRDGLLPNMFPDGSNDGLYHTADATLWFFHAIDRYLAYSGDRETLVRLLPVLEGIVEHHQRGTRFGIGVDPADGLLRQGAEGYQLTWMDAKVDGWVVTPRRGKAVEINALWYNALCLMEGWTRELRGAAVADPIAEAAARARESFNRRFWFADGGWLYDVIDGPDGDSAELRPNQLLAISLAHPVLDQDRWATVLEKCERHLLTPVGLRSLSPESPNYKPRYFGDLRTRDAAYHQGTVWAWLIGPFVDAWIKVHPEDRMGARRFLRGLLAHLDDFGVGSIAEIFDAEPPYTPRGCVAQAWSVAEVLRCVALTQPTAPEAAAPISTISAGRVAG